MCLNYNVHGISYPVIKWSYICPFRFFNYYPMSGAAMKNIFQMMYLLEKVIYETWCPLLSFYPILMNNVLDDMIYLVNFDAIFTLYNGDIYDIDLGTFLESLVKEGIKFSSQPLKADYMLCDHEDVIFMYCKNEFIYFISTSEYRIVYIMVILMILILAPSWNI